MPPKQPPPDPSNGSAAAFASKLHELRLAAGEPPFREMAAKVHISYTSLSRAAQGKSFPTWETTQAFVRACGAETDLETWRAKWDVAHIEIAQEKRRRKEQQRETRSGKTNHDSWFEVPQDEAVRSDPVADFVVDLAAELAADYAAARKSVVYQPDLSSHPRVDPLPPPDVAPTPGVRAADPPASASVEPDEDVRLERVEGQGQLRRVVVGSSRGRGAHRRSTRLRRPRDRAPEWGNWARVALAIMKGVLIVAPTAQIVWAWIA